jgi:hypothetical protein
METGDRAPEAGNAQASNAHAWPALPLAEWKDTYATLHMWLQMVGKIRLALSPHVNHWWESTLYVTARGLTTSPIPHAAGVFEIHFDFLDHRLIILTSDGALRTLRLAPRSVADFYRDLMATLHMLGIEPKIWSMPVEIPAPIPFEKTRCMPPTTPNTPTASGEFSFPWIASSRNFAVDLSASAARCISGGAASTMRSRASPGAAPRSVRVRTP